MKIKKLTSRFNIHDIAKKSGDTVSSTFSQAVSNHTLQLLTEHLQTN